MSSSLSSVVSNLVRASMGSSVSNTVQDDDLDRHVADLILREAKKKAERYGQHGIRAYLSNNDGDSNAPKTNKRFLTSIIRSTDDHNKTILRAQAEAAQEIKREREEQERRERRARAQEAVEAERMRRAGRRTKRKRVVEDEDGWDRWDGRTASRQRPVRNWATWNGDGEDEDNARRRRSRSRSASRERSGKHRRRHSRHRRSSRSPERRTDDRRSRRHHPSRSPTPKKKYALDDDSPLASPARSPSPDKDYTMERRESELRSKLGAKHDESSLKRTRSPSVSSDRSRDKRRKATSAPASSHTRTTSSRARTISRPPSPTSSSRSVTPGPQLPHQLPSKMDKYFEEAYDPRLDVAPLPAPKVPATGLIDNAEFEGWDAMLELIRNRREDKEEKKRMERLGILPKEKSKKKSTTTFTAAGVSDRWGTEAVSVMDIEYKKKGSVREWDLGKEGF